MKEHIIEQPIPTALELNYMPYAMAVIVARAIPEIDGFKPSHRKLLYTMYKMGLLTGGRVKSADVVGQTMRLNPHGDGAIYETLVRLTRGNEALLHPFIDSKGNFGKQYSRDMAYAASRYTEVKLDALCHEIFKDIDKNNVDMVDNYNATTTEPILLPTTFPNLLVTPNQGIAVGMASNVCSFNLKEICKATVNFMKGKTVNLLTPDFSTGAALVYKESELQTIFSTGRGSFKLRAKYRFDKKNNCIEVYELPYTTTIEAVLDKIALLVKQNKLREVSDARDETDLKGLKITIDLKRGTNPDTLMHKLYSQTTLQDTFSCNFNFLVDGRPRTMGIEEILTEWLRFRIACLRRQFAHDIEKKKARVHLLQGLQQVVLDIDRAIAIIRKTEQEESVIPNLMAAFEIDRLQAEYVAEIRLRNLNKQYLLNRVGELEAILDEIRKLEELRTDDNLIKNLIAEQLTAVARKYGAPRRTEIVYDDLPEIKDDFVDDYALKLFLTADGYLKKISLVSLRSSGEQYLKEGDSLVQEIETTNKAEVMFFTDNQQVYKAKVYDLPDSKASSLGEYLANYLELEPGEKIVFAATTTGYEGFLLFAYENGKLAKVQLSGYATKMNRKKLVNAYSHKSKLLKILQFEQDADVFLQRGTDKAMVLNTALLSPIASKSTSGVQVFTMRKATKLTDMRLLAELPEELQGFRVKKIPSVGFTLQNQLELT